MNFKNAVIVVGLVSNSVFASTRASEMPMPAFLAPKAQPKHRMFDRLSADHNSKTVLPKNARHEAKGGVSI
jgi:hypothetical protein